MLRSTLEQTGFPCSSHRRSIGRLSVRPLQSDRGFARRCPWIACGALPWTTWRDNGTSALQITCTTCVESMTPAQVCKLWNDAELEVRDDFLMSKALSNSYAIAAAFAPLDAVPDMLAGKPAFRTAESIDPSAFKMIGFARVISDGAFAALLLDVVVHPDFRRNGIGRRIVNLLMKKCIKQGASACVVFAPRERVFFWKCGFRWSNRYKVMSMPEEWDACDSRL